MGKHHMIQSLQAFQTVVHIIRWIETLVALTSGGKIRNSGISGYIEASKYKELRGALAAHPDLAGMRDRLVLTLSHIATLLRLASNYGPRRAKRQALKALPFGKTKQPCDRGYCQSLKDIVEEVRPDGLVKALIYMKDRINYCLRQIDKCCEVESVRAEEIREYSDAVATYAEEAQDLSTVGEYSVQELRHHLTETRRAIATAALEISSVTSRSGDEGTKDQPRYGRVKSDYLREKIVELEGTGVLTEEMVEDMAKRLACKWKDGKALVTENEPGYYSPTVSSMAMARRAAAVASQLGLLRRAENEYKSGLAKLKLSRAKKGEI